MEETKAYKCEVCGKGYYEKEKALKCEERCKNLACSFCGKTKDEVKVLIAGIKGRICEECVYKSLDVLIEKARSQDG